MRLARTVTDAALSELETASADEIQDLPIVERFQAVRALIDEIKVIVPEFAEYSGYPVTEHGPAGRQAIALRRLAESVRHTQTYLAFLEESRRATLERIANDEKLMQRIERYDHDLSDDLRKFTLREIHKHHANASQKTCFAGIRRTNVGFFEEARQYYPRFKMQILVAGYFNGKANNGQRAISINTHPDTQFDKIVEISQTIHHETVHDQAFQLGMIYKNGGRAKLGDMAQDAKIIRTLFEQQAIIPPGIRQAYRAQLHEVVARDQEDGFCVEFIGLLQDRQTERDLNIPSSETGYIPAAA